MGTVVIYHSDADGFGAAYVAWKTFGDTAEYHPWNYEKPIKMDLVRNKQVLILDFSFDRETMIEIAEEARDVLLLDHHVTAMEQLKGLPYCRFSTTQAGCTFTWSRLFPSKSIPTLLLYIEDRDLWKFKLPFSKEVTSSLSSYPMEFELWDSFIKQGDSIIERLKMEGEAIQRHSASMVKMLLGKRRLMKIGKYTVEAVNTRVYQSEVGHALSQSNVFGVTYYDTDTSRIFSLRSNGDMFDVGELAKSLGGGGHKAASGFEVPL